MAGACRLAGAWLCMMLVASPLAAHHSASAYYDISKTITITGSLSRIAWRNPHVFFYVEVKEAGGRAATWTLESQSPSALERLGLRRGDLKQGDLVTVDLMPALKSPNRGRVRVLRHHGRSVVDFGGAATP